MLGCTHIPEIRFSPSPYSLLNCAQRVRVLDGDRWDPCYPFRISAKSLYSDDKPVHYNMYISKEGRHVRHDGADLSAKGHELLLSTVVNLPTPCLWLLSFTFTKHFHSMHHDFKLYLEDEAHIVKCLTTLYFLIIFSFSSSHVLTAVKALSCLFYKTSQVLALQKNLKVQSA